MISANQNLALVSAGQRAVGIPAWAKYAEYCKNREKGLRDEAMLSIVDFMKAIEHWSGQGRRAFVEFLMEECELNWDGLGGLLPHQLKEGLVKEVLEEWCKGESRDSRPFRWYGRVFNNEQHLTKALEINPEDDTARTALLDWVTYHIDYSLHHLPEGYIGEPEKDLASAAQIQRVIDEVRDPEKRKSWQQELDAALELIHNYIEWRKSGTPNLEAWGKEKNKRVGHGS